MNYYANCVSEREFNYQGLCSYVVCTLMFGLAFVMISIILFKLTMAILWSMRWHLRSLLAMKIILTTFLAYKSFVGELIFIVSALKASQLLNWPKGQTNSKWFFQADVSSKKRMIKFDLFSFVFWKKVKTPKRHLEINWSLVQYS